MKNFLNRFLQEKGISQDRVLEVTGSEWGTNFIPISSIVEFLSSMPKEVQGKVKTTIIHIDYLDGNVVDFLVHIAKGMTIDFLKRGTSL